MPRSSNAQLSQETVQELETQFYNFLDSLSFDEKKMFFGEFLTNEEKMMIYKRLALYWCLLEGYPLAKIQQLIGVTHDTTRVYNKKKNMLSDDFKSLLKRIGSDSKFQTQEATTTVNEQEHVETPSEEQPSFEAESNDVEQKEENQTSEYQPEVPHYDDFRIETREEHDFEVKNEDEDTTGEPVEVKITETVEFEKTEEPETQEAQSNTEEWEETKFESSEQQTQPEEAQQTSEEDETGEEKKKNPLAKFFGF